MESARLSPGELSDLIGLVYESAFDTPQWSALLNRISALFPGTAGLVVPFDGDVMMPCEATTPGLPRALLGQPVLLNCRTVDNRAALESLRRAPNGFIPRSRKFFSEEQWVSTHFYNDYLKPAGFHHMLTLKLDSHGPRGAFMSFVLPDDPLREAAIHDPLFDLLKLLSPHAVRAQHLARALTMANRATRTLGGVLDAIIVPMLVTDAESRFVFGNASGRRLLDRGAPFRLSPFGRRALPSEPDTHRLYQKIRDIDAEPLPSGLRLDTDGGPLLLCITPFRPSMADASAIDRHLFSDERLYAVFTGHAPGEAMNARLLQDVFDLTPREAEVCMSILGGQSAADISEASKRSLKTVRNQIQAIHEKVGVTSNTALMDALAVFRTVGTMFEEDAAEDRDQAKKIA